MITRPRSPTECLKSRKPKWNGEFHGGRPRPKRQREKKLYVTVLDFEFLAVVTMKSSMFWNVTPCSLVDVERFGGICSLHLQGRRVSQTRSRALLGLFILWPWRWRHYVPRNVGKPVPYCTVSYPRRYYSSYVIMNTPWQIFRMLILIVFIPCYDWNCCCFNW
jgi:hypothetical protein